MFSTKLKIKLSVQGLLLAIFLITASEVGAAEPPKLAVMAESPEAKTLADVLTVQWSLKGGVTLLERADLEKVLSEQALTGGNQKDYVKLGQLLGADGLIILETAKSGTNSVLATRLVAVSPGVVLDIKGFSLPVKDIEGWSEYMAQSHTPLLPKLKVPRSAAVPISILNLRASLDSPANRDLERQLTTLTVSRLAQQREFFVLERQRLSQLTWEKTLKGVDEAPFWTGSFLLEGTLDKDGFDPKNTTVSARLKSANDGAVVPIELSGARTNLAGLVDKLASRVSESILKRADWPAWDAKAEADKFFDESVWAERWGLFEQAQQAIDAAWALGRRNAQTARVRLEINRQGADSHFQRTWYNNLRVLTGRPEPKQLAFAIQAASIFHENTRLQSIVAELTDITLIEQGLVVLETDSRLLEHFRYSVRDQRGNEKSLEELQCLCLELNQYLDAKLGNPGLDKASSQKLRNKLYDLQFRSASFWFSGWKQAASFYRDFLRSDRYPLCRRQVLTNPDFRFIFWRFEDRMDIRKAWAQMVDELCRSDDLRLRCEGQLLRLRDQLAWESADGRGSASGTGNPATEEMQTALYQQVATTLELVWDDANEEFTSQVGVDLIDALEELISRKCSGWVMPIKETLSKEQEARRFGRFKHFLRTATTHEVDRFSALDHGLGDYAFKVTPTRARALLPLLYDYRQRFPNGDWIKSIVGMVEKNSVCNFEELRQWLLQAGAADYTTMPALVRGKVFSEAEAVQLRPLFEAYKSRVPAAASIVDQLLNTQIQTEASRIVTARMTAEKEDEQQKQNHARIYEKLKLTLENGDAFDAELNYAGRNPEFTREESRVLLELLQNNRGKSKAHPQQLGMLEVRLKKTANTVDDLLEYLRTAQKEDEDILGKFFSGTRILSPEEAEAVMPLWQRYKRRMPDNPKLHRVVEFKLGVALKRKTKQ